MLEAYSIFLVPECKEVWAVEESVMRTGEAGTDEDGQLPIWGDEAKPVRARVSRNQKGWAPTSEGTRRSTPTYTLTGMWNLSTTPNPSF